MSNDVDLKLSKAYFSSVITDDQLLKQLTGDNYSSNSLISIINDWNRFVEFCQLKSVSPFPSSVTAVRLYIQSQRQTRKLSTLKRYLISIGIIHRCNDLSDPTNHRQVKFLLQELRLEKKDDAKQAAPFQLVHLETLNEKLGHSEDIKDIRDVCVWNIMFETMIKRSELKSLQTNQIAYGESDIVTLDIDQVTYALSQSASGYLVRWINMANIHNGIVFRSINRHGTVGVEVLNDSSIYRIVRRASDELGLKVKFSGQSTRVGATQELAQQGYALKEIQTFGRWASPAMPAQYLGNKPTAEQEKRKYKKAKPWD
ncbi:tyrosine-type recombinase/integrase [Aliivibrio kagoshimensis]|uniref:tyrosine-type recombinase/integrase n=1 Tax=Aliivibrio kagoshimensis TaxID=2910230 RepID=UPI003D10B779